MPELERKCIASWKKYFPDYKIREWNESNFDINCCDYVREAYIAKKWAFVSDYVRFYVIYKYGGIYFDTDVEVIRDMSAILNHGQFMGCEVNNKGIQVNPGLGIGAEVGNDFYRKMLNYYGKLHFNSEELGNETVVDHVTRLMKNSGWTGNGYIEEIDGIFVYPPEYFCPLNFLTGEMKVTENTFSIHHYSGSWLSKLEKIVLKIEQIDEDTSIVQKKIKQMIALPFRGMNTLHKRGLKNAIMHWLKIKS